MYGFYEKFFIESVTGCSINDKVITVSDESSDNFYDEQSITEAFGHTKERTDLAKKILKLTKSFLLQNGCSDVSLSKFAIGGENSKFLKGTGKTLLLGISSKTTTSSAIVGSLNGEYYGSYSARQDSKITSDTIDSVIKIIKDNKQELINNLKEELNIETSISIEYGRLGVVNISITIKKELKEK